MCTLMRISRKMRTMILKSKNMPDQTSVGVYLVVFLVLVWVVLSFTRTIYNFSKVYTEEMSWISLDDSEKRVRLFGDLYRVVSFISGKTSLSSNILLLAPGGKTFYVSRYYLYPRRITYARSLKEMETAIRKDSFDYLVVFQTSERGLNEYDSLGWKIERSPESEFSIFDNKDATLKLYKL